MPTYNQAAYYSATTTYLNAVKAVGSTDADKVMEQLHKTKVDDMFTSDGIIRPDGLLQHSMYVMQVKTPAESKGPWDYYKLVKNNVGGGGLRIARRLGLPAGQEVARQAAISPPQAPHWPGPRRDEGELEVCPAGSLDCSGFRAPGCLFFKASI